VEAMRETEEKVLAQHRRHFGESGFSVINSKYFLAQRLIAEERYEEALDLLQQVSVLRSERYGPDHRKTRQCRFTLATTLAKLGRHDAARNELAVLTETCARTEGDGDDETLHVRLWYVSSLIDTHEYDIARSELRKIFAAIGARKGWDSKSEERAENYWHIVSTDEIPG
jgi:hypothetical protein